MSTTPEMSTTAEPITTVLSETRQRTLDLISDLDPETLETVHSTLLSPLVWDLGHIAAFEDLWISRTFGTAMLEPELMAVYDADETPRAERGELAFLRTDDALDFLQRTREHTLERLAGPPASQQDRRLELIIRHELQHHETMLQALQIAGLPCGLRAQLPDPERCVGDGLAFVDFAGASVEIGWAHADGFAYDNESPRHPVELAPFRIAASPVSNRAWQAFIAADGYHRRELWSDAGWAWRTGGEGDGVPVTAPLYWNPDGTRTAFDTRAEIDPDAPVCHIAYFEAEAFARHHGARLPTEFEWEAAAATPPADPAATAPSGMSLSVWQWTSTEFHGYPGFRADPYPEYSEQFFGHGYRVLRGGAWVSSPRVATPQFRNWDHSQRRQIFSGLRLAVDA
jgi:iron(II)-dependent oxidoreductase